MSEKDEFKLEDALKTVFLAGVGAAAATGEKSKEILDELVKKGKITVEQGKVLNEELRHKVEEAGKKAEEDIKEAGQKAKENVREAGEKDAGKETGTDAGEKAGTRDFTEFLNGLTPEEKEALKKQLGG